MTFLRAVVPILLLVIAIGACDARSSPTPVPGAASQSAASPTEPSTTETEWGTIWDELPAWYPVPHTAEPAIVGSGPVTATFTVPATPEGSAASMQAALEGVGLSTLALSGPLEDGGYVIDSAGDGDCRLQTIFSPAGDQTIMTVFVGTGCPFH